MSRTQTRKLRFSLGLPVLLVALSLPLVGSTAGKDGAKKEKDAPKPHILQDKDCPQELEFQEKLKTGIRESNLAIFPLVAVAVVEEAAVISESYWDEKWNTFVDGARKRAKEAGVLKDHKARSEGFDTRSDLGKLCQAVASRDIGLCETPTPEQRTRCLLQVGLFSDCAVAGVYSGVCHAITKPNGGSCEKQGGSQSTCKNLAAIRESLDEWCGPEGARKPTPECLGAMAVNARINGAKSCTPMSGLENLGLLCDAMVSGNRQGCGQGLAGLKSGESVGTSAEGLPPLKTHIEGALLGTSGGQRALLLWAGATRKAVCHVRASIVDPEGAEVAVVEDVVRVLDDRDTDTQILVPLGAEVDVFTGSVTVVSHCTGRYWW